MVAEADQSSSLAELYAEAWSRFGVTCLWSLRQASAPSATDAETTAKALRANGDLEAWRFADRLRNAAHAA